MHADALHVGIIMDGNGRWAAARGLPRTAGHTAGARAVRRTVEAATRMGLGTLTLYAFSSDNWRRPPEEVEALMRLFRRYLAAETARCVTNGVRFSVIGRRDRLPEPIVRAIEAAEEATAEGRRLHLRVAVDYSARDSIVRAAELAGVVRQRRGETGRLTREEFARALGAADNAGDGGTPDVDLLIRTGGEQRLSDFLLWECAYAELLFLPRMWPDFGESDLEQAVQAFARRERRFGGLSQTGKEAAL